MTLISTIREAFQRHALAAPGDAVLVAVSGGADSTALLRALHEMRAELEIELAAAHLNHKLRGAESDGDEAYCAELAAELGVEFIAEEHDVAARARLAGGNLEETAREIRYAFLERAADKLGAARIAVAHTADDQAETVLLRLLRGAGRTGLGGMRPMRGRIIRPLLGATREEVLAFLRERGIAHREDSSNRDENFARVLLRRRIAPLLRELNPSFARTLAAAADHIAEEDDFLRELAGGVLADIGLDSTAEDTAALDAEAFASLHPALQRLVLRRLLARELGSLRGIEAATVEAMRRCALGVGPGVDLADSVFLRDGGELLLRPHEEDAPAQPPAFQHEVEPGGYLRVNEVDKSFRLRNIEVSNGLEIEALSGPRRALLDAGAVGEVLKVRNRLPGDRYRPLGAPGRQKLQDLFVNAKLPRRRRDEAVVFMAGDRICWVSGLRVGEEFKVTPSTTRILIIEEVDDG